MALQYSPVPHSHAGCSCWQMIYKTTLQAEEEQQTSSAPQEVLSPAWCFLEGEHEHFLCSATTCWVRCDEQVVMVPGWGERHQASECIHLAKFLHLPGRRRVILYTPFWICRYSTKSSLLEDFQPSRHPFHCRSFRSGGEGSFLKDRLYSKVVHCNYIQKDCKLCLKVSHLLLHDSWEKQVFGWTRRLESTEEVTQACFAERIMLPTHCTERLSSEKWLRKERTELRNY